MIQSAFKCTLERLSDACYDRGIKIYFFLGNTLSECRGLSHPTVRLQQKVPELHSHEQLNISPEK